MPCFSDNESALPHAVGTGSLIHFRGVKISVISDRKGVDILIGQSDKLLLTVLKEQDGKRPNEPNTVLVVSVLSLAKEEFNVARSNSLQTLKVQASLDESNCNACAKLRHEIDAVKDALREHKLLDEEIQLSRNDELTCSLVESFTKVVDCRYEIPVPFKSDIIKVLSNNCNMALQRTLSWRKSVQEALK